MDEMFEKWAEYDPLGTGILTPEQFAFFIHDMAPPIGLKDNNMVKYEYDLSNKKARGYLISDNKKIVIKKSKLFQDMCLYNIPVYFNKIHISDACKIISYNAVVGSYREKLELNSEELNKMLARGWMMKYKILKRLYRESKVNNPHDLPPLRVTDYFAG
mmetsp:Transcript_23774/g.20687  ORF Transcript_23774/g.20687 Transcript_23774/m.20687 type:complete len:159 (+) Transcript_23774:562-1038(+)